MRAPYSYREDPAVPAFADDHPLLVFDGCCGLCSGWARTVLRHDRKGRFRLTPSQSPVGVALYAHYRLDPNDTYLLLHDGVAFTKAAASLRMARQLGPPFSLALLLWPLPSRWLDAVYDLVARNRYRFAGRTTACMVPTPQQAARFL